MLCHEMWGGTCKKVITAPRFDCGMGHSSASALPKAPAQKSKAASSSQTFTATEIFTDEITTPSFNPSNFKTINLLPPYSKAIEPISGKSAIEVDPKDRYRVLLGSKQVGISDSVDIFNTILDSEVPTYGAVPKGIETSNLATLAAMDIPAPSNFHLSIAQEIINRKLREEWAIKAISNYYKSLSKERIESIEAAFIPNRTKELLEALDGYYPDSLASILLRSY